MTSVSMNFCGRLLGKLLGVSPVIRWQLRMHITRMSYRITTRVTVMKVF